ncbi:polymorphic toxin type 15 domain-containing protein [Bacillus cereus group sp. BfR-BA-01430]|uniref:polymorphic toxin type 15 domain-containing protein n=1 Tax=Bacillus cereus group sp. BfR-BA-01430 TaxID=2920346 RepID=UPI001F5A0A01|nr:polymorphic toxin type 15 domain-containing protein [Bacillus cereus group sp. BfR-BA-01430]
MDVHYKSKHWQQMKDGINEITKDAIMKLRQADELLEDIQERIQDLDSDRCIDFHHRKQEKKINTLLEDYTTLQKYCDKAGQIVYEHIDEPFYKKMDEFAQKMRDISIRDFQTKNRIGAKAKTTLPSSHAYGVPQTITTKKEKITVDDIFKDSLAFDHVLRAQYNEVKKQNPDAKLNYKEYRQLVPSMRGFEYTSIEDEQKKLETWRDVAISGTLIVTTIFCPPLGIAASVVYGGLQVKSAIEGEDWGTHRKLSKEEQVEDGFFGTLDLMPGLGLATKAFKGTIDIGLLTKLTKLKEGITDLNPSIGKNVVQSLKDNETLQNAFHTWKKTKVPVAIRSADTGMGIKIPYIERSTVGEIAENFARVRRAAKDDAYQLAKGNGGSGVKGTGNGKHLNDVPKIKEIEVNFNRNVKHDSEEFARQLKDQEKGMNELTVDEYLKNRERYIAQGRAIEGNAAQQAAREEAYVQKVNELQREGLTLSNAKKKAKEWLDTQAALHNPDQIAGGKAEIIGGMGDKRINSSIGSQWRYRIDIVDEQIKELAKNMTPEQLKNTYLNVKLTH